jgi:iron chelate ABC transporter, ATP-binding protein
MDRDASEGEEADAVSLRRRLGTVRNGRGDAGFPRGEDGGGDAGIALRVDGMRASYGRVRALTGVSFAVERGRICGLVGTNGSGKSTLIKAIMGAVHSTGDVRLLGMDPTSARRRGLVGYVPQNEGVDWDFPIAVEDVVAMGRYGGLGPARRLKAEDRAAVDGALELVDLLDLRRRPVGALSGGQRKRVFIARAIAQGARLFLLDEPFAGVDKPSEALITGLLRELAAEGATMLVATHDLSGLPSLCDEALLLQREVVFHGPVAEALEPDVLGRAFGLVSPAHGRAPGPDGPPSPAAASAPATTLPPADAKAPATERAAMRAPHTAHAPQTAHAPHTAREEADHA